MGGSVDTVKARLLWPVALLAVVAALGGVPDDETIRIGFSPSDRYLACATREGRLIIHDLEKRTSSEIQPSGSVAPDGGFEWSPAGDRLAFCLRQRGTWNLALADPGGSVTLLSHDEWRDLQPTWSLDGRGIYYVSSVGGGYHGDYDIRYYDLTTRQTYPIIRAPHDQVEPRLSPDGRWLAAISYQHGNPLILLYALKTTRAIQISPPPAYRGNHLRLLAWLGDSRRLLYEVEQSGRFLLMECEVESEKSETRDSSNRPFDSVVLDRGRNDVLYVTGGRAFRVPTQPRWGRKQRLGFDNLRISQLAVRHRDDRLAAVAEGRLLALASAAGGGVAPLLNDSQDLLEWGDLELQRGRKKQGLAYYDEAFRRVRQRGGAEAETEVARLKFSRAPLLCGLGYPQVTSDYLRDAQRVLEKTMDASDRDRLYLILALNEYVWSDRREAARALLQKIPLTAPSSEDSTAAALLRQVLDHSDKQVRQEIRRGLAALWRGKTDDWINIFQQLLQAHPTDPVVRAVYGAIGKEPADWLLMGVFAFPSKENVNKLVTAMAKLTRRYPEIVARRFEMNREWFDSLWESFTILHDADGLKRLILRYGSLFLNREEAAGFYHRYWMTEGNDKESDLARDAVLAQVLFDPEVLAIVDRRITYPAERADVCLAKSRRALVAGDAPAMKTALAELDRPPATTDEVFRSDPLRAIARTLLQGEIRERLDAPKEAVARYREAATAIENLMKEPPHSSPPGYLARLLNQSRFRADLLERGATVRDELDDLVAIERAVGDHLMTDSNDPTSLLNGIHNYFSLLGRASAPTIKDLAYLKTGESYRRLGRWCEAAFCLRVAAQSRERFVARCARAELSALYRELEDPGLAAY